jgi:hypothetical protein
VTRGLGTATGFVVAALTTLGQESPAAGCVRLAEVALPAGWRQAARVILVLEGMTTPRGEAFVVRVRARAPGVEDVALGSFGVLADAPGATGARPPATHRVDVTRGLRRWAERHPEAQTVNVALVTLDGRSRPIVVAWDPGHAKLETRTE